MLLVDGDDLIDLLDSLDAIMVTRSITGSIQVFSQGVVEYIEDE